MIKKNPTKKETRGRPRTIDSNVLLKLETAFSFGASVREAIAFSGVKSSTFYDYLNENPEFSERIELLKEKMPLKARHVIYKALEDNDVNTAKWLLERKKRDEFGNNVNIDHTTLGKEIKQNNILMSLPTDDLLKIEEMINKAQRDNDEN